MTKHGRRRVLQFAGAGTVASLAGCTAPSSDDGDDPGEQLLTAAVQPSEAELQEINQEIEAEVADGDLSEEEAPIEFQERQAELMGELAETFEGRAEDENDLVIEESLPDNGAYLVGGDFEALAAILNDGDLTALLPEQEFRDLEEALAAQSDPEDFDEEDLEGE